MQKLREGELTRDNPPDLEIICELDLRSVVAHEHVALEVRVRLALHDSEALETPALID